MQEIIPLSATNQQQKVSGDHFNGINPLSMPSTSFNPYTHPCLSPTVMKNLTLDQQRCHEPYLYLPISPLSAQFRNRNFRRFRIRSIRSIRNRKGRLREFTLCTVA